MAPKKSVFITIVPSPLSQKHSQFSERMLFDCQKSYFPLSSIQDHFLRSSWPRIITHFPSRGAQWLGDWIIISNHGIITMNHYGITSKWVQWQGDCKFHIQKMITLFLFDIHHNRRIRWKRAHWPASKRWPNGKSTMTCVTNNRGPWAQLMHMGSAF